MRYRQVHLDFHTSEKIYNIGSEFSKEQFQNALKKGHVDSITVFSKCHHGWAYHPSNANEMHPGLSFDLLKAQIEAAHEIGVKTPVYLSAGLDEKMARRHPEWLVRNIDESTTWIKDFITPGYHDMCFNSPYLDYLLPQIKEVCENYDADGIFLDIAGIRHCYCQNCVQGRINAGMDPYDEKAVHEWGKRVYENYCKKVRETIDSVKPGLPVFHNGGHITRGNREYAHFNSHLELESLPTGGWGYDHFPLSAGYARTLGMDFLGMTGKFHGTWGEFGGFKHPNALRYEVALSVANGARCSIGDQLHPNGKMDENTYNIIGQAYDELERKEPWLEGAEFITDIALLSYEAYSEKTGDKNEKYEMSDAGAIRMLLEGNYLFNVIDYEEDFNKYKVIILPDGVKVFGELKEKFDDFTKKGGKILATGISGLDETEEKFEIDFGIEYKGESEFTPDYFIPEFEMEEYEKTSFVIQTQGYRINPVSCEVLGNRQDPYFNRTFEHFCSHQHTPNEVGTEEAAMTENKNGIYISWSIFEEYANRGSYIYKLMVKYALDKLLGDAKTVKTNLPAQGVVTLTKQKERFILHALYACPVKRGNVEVIEDIIPMHNTSFEIKVDKKINKVYTAPCVEIIDFEQIGDVVKVTIPEFENHIMIVME